MVAIQCITYNHEPYIRDALEGFVMQKADFPFVAIVHDDASTDNTAEIVKEYAAKYPDIILPIYEEENQYSKRDGSLSHLLHITLNYTRAKYIALCEGDDYWIDPLKLQKQVDFLESHPNYGMCYTKAKYFFQGNNQFTDIFGGPNETFEQFLMANTVPTLSAVFRHDIQSKYHKEIQPQSKKWSMGDYPLWLFFSHESKIKLIDNVTGVYRILPNSASHFDKSQYKQQLNFLKSSFDVSLYYMREYP
ncbi:MAG: glycosyltransferase, partial [Allobaculum sp.]|nr:glycosyltransferase [Allobaculum sp.]